MIMRGKTILILGGGVGGIVTANALRESLASEHRIVVVDKRAEYIFTPSLLWVMTGWRQPDQITKDLRASYSYDLTTSTLRNSSSGSHEIMMTYCFTIEIPPKEKGSYRNPIFL